MQSSVLGGNILLKSCGYRLGGLRWLSQAKTTETSDNDVITDDIERKPINCDKSRLLRQHRNMLKETLPYSEPQSWIHLSEKYQRKMYGRYGDESGVDPRICFKTKEDLSEYMKLNAVTEFRTLPEMIEIVRKEAEEKKEKVKKREDEIAAKLQKLEQWKSDLKAKIAKKEAEVQKAKERKERLIEEVRRHFGFKVDPREDRFKEMLEQKEKEDKKKQKEERRKAKEEKTMAKIIKNTSTLDQ